MKKEFIQIIEAPDFLGPCALWPPLGVPVIVRLHGSATYLSAEMNEPIGRLIFLLERLNLLRAKTIVSVSKYALQKTQKYFKIKIHGPVIYNPVMEPKAPDFPLLSRRFSQRIVFVGTLMRKKGVFSLIQAWPKVLDFFPDASLHIVGKDSLDYDGSSISAKLKSKLAPNIIASVYFYGHVDKKAVFRHLATAEVAIFPSYCESCSMVAFEAVAAGCPLIFTNRSSGPEIFKNGVTAILIDPDNIPEIATAICRVLGDKSLSDQLTTEASKQIMRDYSLSQILDKNETFYSDVINSNTLVEKAYNVRIRVV